MYYDTEKTIKIFFNLTKKPLSVKWFFYTKLYYFTNSYVSLAIIRSSFVGTTITTTFESGVDIICSIHLKSCFDSSNLTHNRHNLSTISFLITGEFSIAHAVRTIVSTPSKIAV